MNASQVVALVGAAALWLAIFGAVLAFAGRKDGRR